MAKMTVAARKHAKAMAQRERRTELHLGMTLGDWRTKKRQEWATLCRALEVFNYGSAYTPAGDDLDHLERAARRITEALKQDWICW